MTHVVLVVNSEAFDSQGRRAALPETALYVFFNNVCKVLDEPFAGHAILFARSGVMGANIVHRTRRRMPARSPPERHQRG